MINTPYYLFSADDFINNYLSLKSAFCNYYPDYQIAYSFKTNYTPAVCKIVLELGGYAEVVSDMEFELAKRVGFPINRIIYNGPGKEHYIEECIINGGLLNVDNYNDIKKIREIAKNNHNLSVGVRVNFDIGNDLHSRFGIDADNGELENVIFSLTECGVSVSGLHYHISRARGLQYWKKRIDKILEIADKVERITNSRIKYLDLGSGMYGDLITELSDQFTDVPTYDEYASVVACTMNQHYQNRSDKPILFTEPGTTLVSRYFSLFSTVLDIKTIREKNFALLDCSFHNVGEICGLKNVPMKIIVSRDRNQYYDSIDLVGYTCLEQDIIIHNYCGNIGVGDIIEFCNVGGYSIVDKPPFIHPDIPVYMDKSGERSCIKRAQTIDDIFAPYLF